MRRRGRRVLLGMDGYGDRNDIRLKKCGRLKDGNEICATYYYRDAALSLDYIIPPEDVKDELLTSSASASAVSVAEYIKANVWIWNEEGDMMQCDGNLLVFIEDIVCLQRKKDKIVAMIFDEADANKAPIQKFNLLKYRKWDRVVEINDDKNHRKLCEYISEIEICFEIASDGDKQKIEITAERVLPPDQP